MTPHLPFTCPACGLVSYAGHSLAMRHGWNSGHGSCPGCKTFLQHHDTYPFDLAQAAPDVILREFEAMVGGVVYAAPIPADGVEGLYEMVMRQNNDEARAVAGTGEVYWLGLDVVLWRGCFAIRASQRWNKRRDYTQKAQFAPSYTPVSPPAYDFAGYMRSGGSES